MLRANRLCHACSVITRTLIRWAGSAPANRSWTNRSRPSTWATARRSRPAKWRDCSAWLVEPQSISRLISAPATKNLSLGERPVKRPVVATSAPPSLRRASPRSSAARTNASGNRPCHTWPGRMPASAPAQRLGLPRSFTYNSPTQASNGQDRQSSLLGSRAWLIYATAAWVLATLTSRTSSARAVSALLTGLSNARRAVSCP